MPSLSRLTPIAIVLAALAAGCSETLPTRPGSAASVRVVNAFTTPVDVLVDGSVVQTGLAAGAIDTVRTSLGSHTLVLRPTNGAAPVSRAMDFGAGLGTVVAVRAPNGAVATATLDDTGSVVPAGATKVRVLHLAPNAGTLQVFRTQPDWQTPIAWQFPFTYQPEPTSLSAPFYQSTVGTWEIRIWKTPTDASGWSAATARVTISLGSGEKKTVLMLDDGQGGVKIELL